MIPQPVSSGLANLQNQFPPFDSTSPTIQTPHDLQLPSLATHDPPHSPPTQGQPQRRYPSRKRTPSTRLANYWTFVSELLEEPLHYKQAALNPDWQAAMDSEINSINRNQTWEIIDRKPHIRPISAKWIYKVKKGITSQPDKFKARVVALRFQQMEGIDYNENFSPVVRWSTIRIIFALAAKYDWPLHHMDVITVFLNETLESDVIMEIPAGFLGANNPDKVCRIKKALYGLRQSPRA